VIDARHCQAQDISGCKGPWPTITVGGMPSGIAIDQQTDTVYVSDVADNTVSVFNGATCNAEDTSGCGQTPATVPVGQDPLGIVDDPANHTVYVPDYGTPAVSGPPDSTTVSMIDSTTCNAGDLAACPATPPPVVDVGASPDDVTVDQATHTVYVTTVSLGNPGQNNGWTVFDANTCNATTQSGCDQLGILPGDPSGPNAAQVDPANETLYTANYDNTVSAFDLRECNAADLGGCATDTPGTVTPFPNPGFEDDLWVTVDAPLHTVYVVYQKDDALLAIDTDICNGDNLAGCATLKAAEIHTGADPESVALDPETQTLYTANHVDNTVSVIDPARCDAETTFGCRERAPEVPTSAAGLAADPGVATTYVANGANLSMIDTTACNAFRTAGCSQAPPSTTAGTEPVAVAVDPPTHTVYVADAVSSASGTLTVFDDRICNAHDQAGCASVSTLQVTGGSPDGLAVNPTTNTIYVATITDGGGPDVVSVFNGATCNATVTGGCGQSAATAPTGPGGDGSSTESVAVNPATNTVYATSVTLGNPFLGHTVYVIDGATCDGQDTSGCAAPPATISVGSDPVFGDANPLGIAVDPATDTVYTANIFNGEGPGTISVINGASCNSQNTSGCGQAPATAPAGFGTVSIAIDSVTHQIYATNTEDSSVTVLNANTCNGREASGCGQAQTLPIVGDYPNAISLDPAVGTAYIGDIEGVSVIPLFARGQF
jgi:DNA-binding beta-propeller fold protein YncE